MTFAGKLKIGDRVNGHEQGLLTVKRIVKSWRGLVVEYDAPHLKRTVVKTYRPEELIDTIR